MLLIIRRTNYKRSAINRREKIIIKQGLGTKMRRLLEMLILHFILGR